MKKALEELQKIQAGNKSEDDKKQTRVSVSEPEALDRRTFHPSSVSCAKIAPSGGGRLMIETRRAQTTFADGLIVEEVSDLWEPWMRHTDAILVQEWPEVENRMRR